MIYERRSRHFPSASLPRWSQLALSGDPIVTFDCAPDLVPKFGILSSRQSPYDLIRSSRGIDLRPPRPFGVEIHKLPDPEFVFGHEAPRELTCGRAGLECQPSELRSLASMRVRL
jgi:hypothetical protein